MQAIFAIILCTQVYMAFSVLPSNPLDETPTLPFSGRSADKAGIVFCDSFSFCWGDSTCCKMADGDWGCCAYSSATCCDDGVHCCPQGTTCGTTSCLNSGTAFPAAPKTSRTPAFSVQKTDRVGLVFCDLFHYCSGDSKCCKKADGGFFCCPEGSTCGPLGTNWCLTADAQFPSEAKQLRAPAFRRQ